jgi:hypothetical protein
MMSDSWMELDGKVVHLDATRNSLRAEIKRVGAVASNFGAQNKLAEWDTEWDVSDNGRLQSHGLVSLSSARPTHRLSRQTLKRTPKHRLSAKVAIETARERVCMSMQAGRGLAWRRTASSQRS